MRAYLPTLLPLWVASIGIFTACTRSSGELSDQLTFGGVFGDEREGIETGSLNGRVIVALARDLPTGYAETRGGVACGADPRYRFHGSWRHETLPALDWWCSTDDGRRGIVTVAGQPHSLEEGRFFVVRVEQGEIVTRQFDVDVGSLFRHKQNLLARSDEAITLEHMLELIFPGYAGALPPDVSGRSSTR